MWCTSTKILCCSFLETKTFDVSICDILFVLYLWGLRYFSHFLSLPLLRHTFSILGPVNVPAHCQHTLQGLSNWPSVNLFLLKHRDRNGKQGLRPEVSIFQLSLIVKCHVQHTVPFLSGLCRSWAEGESWPFHPHSLRISIPAAPEAPAQGHDLLFKRLGKR